MRVILALLCVSCVAHIDVPSAGDSDSGCEPAQVSLLQESHAVSSRLNSAGIRSDWSLYLDHKQPNHQKPFSKWVYGGLLLLAGAALLQERFVSLGKQPILASPVPALSLLLQFLFLWSYTVAFVDASFVSSRNGINGYSISATDMKSRSLVFLGAVSPSLGVLIGWRLLERDVWNQRKARLRMIYCPSLAKLLVFIRSYLMLQGSQNVFVTYGLHVLPDILWTIPAVGMFNMWYLATPDSHKTVYMLFAQCAVCCGRLLGPAIIGLIHNYIPALGFEDLDGVESAYKSMIALYLALVTSLLCSMIVPTRMPGVSRAYTGSRDGNVDESPTPAGVPGKLTSFAAKESIVPHMLSFSLERLLLVAVLHIATVTDLVNLGWSEVSLGFLYALTQCLAILSCFLAVAARRFGCSEAAIIMATYVACLLGTVLRINIEALSRVFPGETQLLLMYVLIICSSTVALAISQSWACRAATHEWFSAATYGCGILLAMQVAISFGPPIGRQMHNLPGGNFAVALLVWILVSAVAMYKAAGLLWYLDKTTDEEGDKAPDPTSSGEESAPETTPDGLRTYQRD